MLPVLGMKIAVLNERPGQHATDALILFAFEEAGLSAAAAFDPFLSSISPGDFSGKLGQVFPLLLNKKAKRVFLAGLGKKAEFSAEKLRKAVRAGARAASSSSPPPSSWERPLPRACSAGCMPLTNTSRNRTRRRHRSPRSPSSTPGP